MRIIIGILLSFSAQFAFANNIPVLNVYTYSSFISEWGPGEKIKKLFEHECHCRIEFHTFVDGIAMLNRLKLKTKIDGLADVVIGLDNNLVAAAKQAGFLQPHHIKPLKNMQLRWWDDYVIPFDYGYFTFIYNTKNIKKPPQSMHDLLNSDNQWKIVYADPRTSTPGLGLVLWMQSIYAKKTPQAWKKLAKKTLTVTQNWSEAYNLMLNNEADFVLSYDTSPIAHMINDNNFDYRAASFMEGHYGQIEVVGVTKNARHFKLARQFLLFLLTPKIQYLLATKNIMHPIVNIPLPKEFKQLSEIKKMLAIPSHEIENNRKKWIEVWHRNVS